MPNSLYVLDFDGVISDTREECLVTSFNAYQKMRNHSPYPVFQAEDISAEYRSKFRECRFLVRVACDFKLLWDMIIAGQHIYPSLSLRQQTLVDLDQLNRYHALFFEQRLCWMEQDLESWLAHNSLYGSRYEVDQRPGQCQAQ